MSFLSSIVILTNFFGAALLRAQPAYTQLETEDAYVFLDSEGVAVRTAKRWICRRRDWSEEIAPFQWTRQEFMDFEALHRAVGDWDWWLCGVEAGEVIYSRDIQKAQRALNLSGHKPAGAPFVPETGRYNWEMLVYGRCGVAQRLAAARTAYKSDLAFRLATLLQVEIGEDRLRRDAGAVLKELESNAKARQLVEPDTSCNPPAGNFYDLSVCRMARRNEMLTKAESVYPGYAGRIEGLRGRDSVTRSELAGITGDADQIKEYLTKAERTGLEQ